MWKWLRGIFELFRQSFPEPTCDKCGALTTHHCGMVCVEMCPNCDRLDKPLYGSATVMNRKWGDGWMG